MDIDAYNEQIKRLEGDIDYLSHTVHERESEIDRLNEELKIAFELINRNFQRELSVRCEVIRLSLEVTELRMKLQEVEVEKSFKEGQREALVQDRNSIQKFQKNHLNPGLGK